MADTAWTLEVLRDVDLGLTAFSSTEIEDASQYSLGVVDGMRIAQVVSDNPELLPNELVDSADTDFTDHDRALGVVAGLLVSLRFAEKQLSEVQ